MTDSLREELLDEDITTEGGGQGFAGMDRDRQREIASKGGKAAHRKGTAHEWDSQEAAQAGAKGGRSRSSS